MDATCFKAPTVTGGNSTGLRSVTVKGYDSHEREAMHAAWFASCDRGEHDHPADPKLVPISVPLFPPSSPAHVPSSPAHAPSSPLRTRASPAVRSVRSPHASSSRVADSFPGPYLWTPSPATSPPPALGRKVKVFSADSETPRASRSSTKKTPVIEISSQSPSPEQAASIPHAVPAPGLRAFAVRLGTQGWVFGDSEHAREKFHEMQSWGRRVEMATAAGFTRALAFAEHVGPKADSDEAQRRARWVEEEHRALQANKDAAAAAHRRDVCDELAAYREGESEHSSDESDSGRFTVNLEEELQLRGSYEDWRAHRRPRVHT
ncbi:hypothetical protein DFH07DRAFT_972700 [Mycena maculata]|uniref:Uncharacterized protein n=1 Tax=Mycena maculata TaxID=230809 RepID=A0AAD7MJB7_9AGAR|nr:hypothetical protein DFH07DRAFT_972700 [Mycena maculata]